LPWTNLNRFCIGKKEANLVQIEEYTMHAVEPFVGKESLALFNQNLDFLSSLQLLVRVAFSDISVKNAEATLEM